MLELWLADQAAAVVVNEYKLLDEVLEIAKQKLKKKMRKQQYNEKPVIGNFVSSKIGKVKST